MKKYILLLLVLLGGMIYGILVGRYGYFPFSVLKNVQDSYQGEEKRAPHNFSKPDIQKLISVNRGNIDSIRMVLTDLIFDTTVIPASLPDTVYAITDVQYTELDNLESMDCFEVRMKYGINSKGYIFHPKQSNDRLLIYHEGHKGDFINGKNAIARFLKAGFTVYAFSMPLMGKNNQPTIFLDKLGEIYLGDHELMRFLHYPLQYFLTPVITMLNYASDKKFKDISMIGLSGGGWTTTLAAAIDPRINYSFPVAGTSPMYIRFRKLDKSYGDFEQIYEAVYSKVDYLDMYIMGSAGEKRLQLQILNKFDPCCFDGDEYKEYEAISSDNVKKVQQGNFSVYLDTLNKDHGISDAALDEVSKKLNSSLPAMH
ncbi:hypothetical protein BH11BAC1_BH11BAC1_21500 [soil metagenome]